MSDYKITKQWAIDVANVLASMTPHERNVALTFIGSLVKITDTSPKGSCPRLVYAPEIDQISCVFDGLPHVPPMIFDTAPSAEHVVN